MEGNNVGRGRWRDDFSFVTRHTITEERRSRREERGLKRYGMSKHANLSFHFFPVLLPLLKPYLFLVLSSIKYRMRREEPERGQEGKPMFIEIFWLNSGIFHIVSLTIFSLILDLLIHDSSCLFRSSTGCRDSDGRKWCEEENENQRLCCFTSCRRPLYTEWLSREENMKQGRDSLWTRFSLVFSKRISRNFLLKAIRQKKRERYRF